MHNRQIAVGLLIGLICIGCAKHQDVVYTGFLGDYSQFKNSKVVKDLFVAKHPTKTLRDYDKFMIAPITVYFHHDAKGIKIEPDKLKELTDEFYAMAKEELSEHYEVVTEPGDGVLLCRIALTDIVANKIMLNLHWTTTASGAGVGGAAIEADFVDSLTNERILAVVDSRKGSRIKYTHGLTKWGHTKGVFKEWIELFVGRLDQLHGHETDQKG